MSFTSVPLSFTGPSYQSRSRPLSSQATRNFYQEINESGKEQYALMSFPGLKEFGVGEGVDRGMHQVVESLYRVAGKTLYSVDSDGVHTGIANVPGSERCMFADDGESLFIVTELKVYVWNGVTIQQITDANITGSKAISFINNQFLYTKDKFTSVSNVGDGTTVNPLNIVGAESNPDNLVRDYTFNQNIYRFGTRTTEIWWNTGAGNPPIERITGNIFNIGLAAIHSVDNTDNLLYWLGDDRKVYAGSQSTKQEISTVAISNEFESYETVDDAIGFTFTLQGQNFYCLTFPTENKTWCVNESLGKNGWFELSSGIESNRWQANSLVYVYGKNIIADETNGKLYELDPETYTNNSEIIQRQRVTSSITGKLLNKAGERVQWSRMQLVLETGVGLIDGQGEDPKIMIEASFDGGKTFKHISFMNIGRLGETQIRCEAYGLDTFYEAMFRLTTSDPVPYFIYSAIVDLRYAGR